MAGSSQKDKTVEQRTERWTRFDIATGDPITVDVDIVDGQVTIPHDQFVQIMANARWSQQAIPVADEPPAEGDSGGEG